MTIFFKLELIHRGSDYTDKFLFVIKDVSFNVTSESVVYFKDNYKKEKSEQVLQLLAQHLKEDEPTAKRMKFD